MKEFIISKYSIPAPMKLYGVSEDFRRMPVDAAARVSEPVLRMSGCPTGGRIRFRTDSDRIDVRIKLEKGECNSGADVISDGRLCASIFARSDADAEYGATVDISEFGKDYSGMQKKVHDVTVYLPRTAPLVSMTISIEDWATPEEPTPYPIEKPVVFYGSSITMGATCPSAAIAYTALAAEAIGANHINLGFGGNAYGEPEMAEYIASLDMSAFVMDYEHNASTIEYLASTHEPFFDIVRKARPDLPILLVSRPDTDRDFLRSCRGRRVIMDTFYSALDAGDRRVDYVDGFYLWGNENRDRLTSDGCHPNELGHAEMAKVVAPRLKALIDRAGKLDSVHVDDSKFPTNI